MRSSNSDFTLIAVDLLPIYGAIQHRKLGKTFFVRPMDDPNPGETWEWRVHHKDIPILRTLQLIDEVRLIEQSQREFRSAGDTDQCIPTGRFTKGAFQPTSERQWLEWRKQQLKAELTNRQTTERQPHDRTTAPQSAQANP
jgi:hypothetical protein